MDVRVICDKRKVYRMIVRPAMMNGLEMNSEKQGLDGFGHV